MDVSSPNAESRKLPTFGWLRQYIDVMQIVFPEQYAVEKKTK